MHSRQTLLQIAIVAAHIVPAASVARADTLLLTPVADNSIFLRTRTPDELFSSGAGDGIFSGRTFVHADNRSRGLVRFDLSAIPCGAAVTAVSLRMTVDRAPRASPPAPVELHRVLAAWGEGASNSFGGSGEPSQPGDANWYERLNPGVLWARSGGDFVALPSAVTSVPSVAGQVSWVSTPDLVADVAAWVQQPSQNFGWLLLNDESKPATVRRFFSREASTPANRPTLRVDYTLSAPLRIESQPLPASACSAHAADFAIQASGLAPLTYQWQIETAPGQWAVLSEVPSTLPCGGSATASPSTSPAVSVLLTACPTLTHSRVRCVVSSPCEHVVSQAVELHRCPPDVNCDGFVDIYDFTDFITCFEGAACAQDINPDFNNDGFPDIYDFTNFVDAFEFGC